MNIQRVVVGFLRTNAYLVADPETKRALVIDPGDEAGKIRTLVSGQGLQVDAVLLTHGHVDHIGAREAFDAPVYIHPLDATLLSAAAAGCGAGNPVAVRMLNHGDRVAWGERSVAVIHTPGHTAGSVCFLTGKVLFSGDTLFHRGVGRTDLPGGSAAQLTRSLRERLFTLDGAVRVLPGHGPETTIAAERS